MSHQNVTRIHLVNRLRVIHTIAMHRSDNAKSISMLRDMRQELTNLQPGFSSFAKWFNRPQQGVFCHVTPSHNITKRIWNWLTGILDQIRLKIEQINVTWTPMHKQPNHSGCSRWIVWFTRSIKIWLSGLCSLFGHHGLQC